MEVSIEKRVPKPIDLIVLEKQVRMKRNKMLDDTDWFVVREKEINGYLPADFKDFRKALRDIPEQAGFPQNVVFPVCKPEWLKK